MWLVKHQEVVVEGCLRGLGRVRRGRAGRVVAGGDDQQVEIQTARGERPEAGREGLPRLLGRARVVSAGRVVRGARGRVYVCACACVACMLLVV